MSIGSINRLQPTDQKERLSPKTFKGLVTPVLTPYLKTPEKAKVDVDSLRFLVDSMLPYVDGLFPAGNAGEGPDLDLENYTSLLKTVIQTRNRSTRNHIPVIAGVLRKKPEEMVEFCLTAQNVGVDGIIVAPMFGDHNPENVVETILNITSLPVILYNNPGMHDNKELPIEVIKSLRDRHPNRVIGIKTSSKDFHVFEHILKLKSEKFKVFQGHTAFDADSLEMGADGIVPVEANMNPKLFKGLELNSKNAKVAFEIGSGKVESLLAKLKRQRKELNMGAAQIVKYHLAREGVFKSDRMYNN